MDDIGFIITPRTIKKVLLAITLITGLFNPLLSIASELKSSPTELNFLTWGDYIDIAVVAEFEAKYHAKVNFILYESDDARNEILTTSGVNGYDLILVDSTNVSLYKRLNWITHFNSQKAPNLNKVELPTLASTGEHLDTCTAYFWGTTGIAYRKDLVPEPITSWQQIFKPAPELKGKIIMSTMSQETVGMALKSLGYSITSSNKKEIEAARQLLIAQAPAVAGYSAVSIDSKKSKLVSGEVSVVVTYNSDALMIKEFHSEIEFVVPEEGGGIWADFICLSATAKHPELAHRFVNFINQPEQAAKNALYINAATPNTEAKKIMPDNYLNNKIIYPNSEVISRSETYQLLSPRTIKKHNAIMVELRQMLQ